MANNKHIDLINMSKKEAVMTLYMNTAVQMLKNNIDSKIVSSKSVNTVIYNLCHNVIQDSDNERLKLLGTNVMSTYIGLGVRVCDMLKGIGIQIENAVDVDATVKQLEEIDGKVVVENFSY